MIARTRMEAPQLPKHLRAATKLWFSDVCEQYELEAHHVLLLTITCDAWDNHSAILLSSYGQQGPRRRTDRLIFKIIAFLAAAIPIFLFVRSIFFRRTTRINEGLREFKKQANLAVSIFLFLIVCVVVFAAGKLAWTWWSSL